jgi:hypothetical protein
VKIHDLKIDPVYYKAVLSGSKRFEVRKNDRDFKIYDILLLREYDRNKNNYTGKEIRKKIYYILDNPEYLREGYIILGL